jgi:hypothetical protein
MQLFSYKTLAVDPETGGDVLMTLLFAGNITVLSGEEKAQFLPQSLLF